MGLIIPLIFLRELVLDYDLMRGKENEILLFENRSKLISSCYSRKVSSRYKLTAYSLDLFNLASCIKTKHLNTINHQKNMSAAMEKDHISSDVEETGSSEEQVKPQRRTKKKNKVAKRSKKQRDQQQSSGPLDSLPVGGDLGNTLGGVTNTLGGVTNNAVDQQGGGDKKSDTLRLRLDLNLEIEIQLKARIHGDLELALL